jgi:hypothetical protein
MTRCAYVENERRCVKMTHDEERQHLLATIRNLDDLIGLSTKAEEATA